MIVLLAVVVALSAACGGHVTASPQASTSRASTTTPTPTTLPAAPSDLRTAISDTVPAGYFEQPTGVGLDGPLDINTEAANESSDPKVWIPMLQQYGFQRGYRRAWFPKGQGTTRAINIRVLLFDPPSEATYFYNFLMGDPSDPANEPTFPVPGVDNSYRFVQTSRDSSGQRTKQVIEMVRGPLMYFISITGAAGSVTADDVITLAHSQAAKAAALGFP